MSFFVDRVDVFGGVREHQSDDGARTLCGQELTTENARLPSGSLRCTRCARGGRARADSLADLRPPAFGAELALEQLAQTIARIDGAPHRAERIRHLVARDDHERASELQILQREAIDISSIRLIAMALEVLVGNRNLGQLHDLCEQTAATN